MLMLSLKGCICYICASLLLSVNDSTCQMFFIWLQKLFSFSRKSNFRILHFQISWDYQMPIYKTRNTFHWITWEVNVVCQWNLAGLCHITKGRKSLKTSAKIGAWKLDPGPFVFAKN